MAHFQTQFALVVDDEFNNRDFAQKLLEKAGFCVYSASNGQEALEIVQRTPQLTIALLDHELPDTTGIALAQQLREILPSLFLVMATMHDHRELIDQAFEAGMNMFLIKPNGFIELYKTLLSGDVTILSKQYRFVIDQYGPRKYRGAVATTAQQAV